MDSKVTTKKELRANKLKALYNNAGQTTAWQTQALEFVGELNHDILRLIQHVAVLRREMDEMKQEKVSV